MVQIKCVSIVGAYRKFYFHYEKSIRGSKNRYNLSTAIHEPVFGMQFQW